MCSKVPDSPLSPAQMLRKLFEESVQALDPGPLVHSDLAVTPMSCEAVTVLALGKSAVSMASVALTVLGTQVDQVCVVAPSIPAGMGPGWITSSHPIATPRSIRAAKALLDAARRAEGQILFLLSGGGSALAALPADGLALADKNDLIARVYAAGAAIGELNVVRKQLSAFKGGGLAAAASVPITTLLVSDVVGDVLSTVSSGPTFSDASTAADALVIVESYLGKAKGPAISFLHRRIQEPAPKMAAVRVGDQQRLLAGMSSLARVANRRASQSGVPSQVHVGEMHGSIASVAETLVAWSRGPGLWISAAEASVQLASSPGRGGRAQQLALTLARAIQGTVPTYVLVAGSDGVDGNSEAAGAIVDHTSWQRLVDQGVDAPDALLRCDAGTALGTLGAQIITGPTGVNHADLILLYRPYQA